MPMRSPCTACADRRLGCAANSTPPLCAVGRSGDNIRRCSTWNIPAAATRLEITGRVRPSLKRWILDADSQTATHGRCSIALAVCSWYWRSPVSARYPKRIALTRMSHSQGTAGSAKKSGFPCEYRLSRQRSSAPAAPTGSLPPSGSEPKARNRSSWPQGCQEEW